MRTILWLIQGIDDTTEAYYKQFKAAISTAELEKCNKTTHIELNKAYANGEDEDGIKMFQAMCLIVSVDSQTDTQGFGMTKIIAPSKAQTTNQKPQLPHTMYSVTTRNRHCHAKYIQHLQQLHFSKMVIQRKITQHQGMMRYPFQKLHTIAARRR